MRISDWSSDVCSSDLPQRADGCRAGGGAVRQAGEGRALDIAAGGPGGDGGDEPRRLGGRERGAPGRVGGRGDRKSVVSGRSVSVRVALGGRRIIKTKTNTSIVKSVTSTSIHIQ